MEDSTQATEPSEAPTTEPTTQPTDPSVAPTEPQQPGEQGSANGGIQLWVVLIVGIAALAVGFVGGFLVEGFVKKK